MNQIVQFRVSDGGGVFFLRLPPQEDVKEGNKNCTIEEKMPPDGKCRPLSCHAAMVVVLHCWKVPQVSGDERMVEQWYGSSHLYVFMFFHGCSIYMYIHVWSRIYIYEYSLFEQCFLQVAVLKICVNNPYDPFHFDARNACFIQCQLQCCVSGVNTFLYSQNPCLKIISF